MYFLYIRDACQKIMDYMQGVDEGTFMASSMLRDAGFRQIDPGMHLGAADSITTTISSAGVTFLTTAVIEPDQAYSNHLFTDDRVNLSRYLESGKGVDSTVQVTGSGTIGVNEYQTQSS